MNVYGNIECFLGHRVMRKQISLVYFHLNEKKNSFSTVYMHKYLWKNTQILDYVDYMEA